MKFYRTITIPVLMAVMILSGLTTACPSQAAIQKAINSAAEIDAAIQTAVDTVNSAANENLITVEQQNIIIPKLTMLSKGAAAFKNAAQVLKDQYGKDIPPSKLAILSALFDDSVIVPFLDLLKELKIIKSATTVIAAIGVIKLAVLAIAQAFDKSTTVSQINNEFERNTQLAALSAG